MSVDSLIGKILGGHRITRKIGEGGMGVVYEAEHNLIGRRAAIKCLLPELSANAEACGRFFIEARAAALISHPSLVDIYDSGHTESGSAYIIMEYLDGEDLGAFLRRERKMDLRMTVATCRQVASALGAVHQKGIVHRDLKPDNLFLVKTPQTNVFRVKVLDFGIAKLTGPENKEMSVKTRTGSVLGTPSYMSPEQCRGHGKVDWRSDVYALGCIMYEMLVGHPPFQGSGYGEVLAQHIYEPPTPIRQLDPALPEGIETLIARMLQKNPEQRLQSMEEFATVLDSLSNIPALVSASGSGGARIETSGAFPMPSPQATPPPMPAPGPPSAALPVREPERTHTTLRGSAAEKVGGRPGKRGLGIPLAIGGALVLVIGTVAVAMRGGASADQPVVTPTARPAEPVAPPPIAQEPVKPPVAAAPIAVATAPSVPEPPVAAANPPASEPKAPAASPDKKPEDIAVAKPEPTAPVPAPVALPIPTATATATAPAPAPAVVPPPVVPPPPAPVTFRVDSEPTGADVLRDGKPVGKTPLDTSLPPQSAKVAFVVALKGYKSSTVELPGDKGGDKKVVLVAEAAVSKPPEARAPEAKPSAIKPGAAPKKAKPVGDKTVNPFK